MIEHPVNLNEVLPFCCSFDRLIFKCFTLPVLRGSGDDLLIIC